VTLVNNGTVAGPLTCANAKDASGNFACQVTATFTVTAGGSIQVNYSGDTNYPASSSSAYINMPDFTALPQGYGSVTAGQSLNITILVTSISGLSGPVTNLGCSGLPTETLCTFNPTQPTLPSNGSVSTTLTITTAALGDARQHESESMRAVNWGITASTLLVGACLLLIPRSQRRGSDFAVLMLIAVLILLASCGGGGSGAGGGGRGGGGSNPVPSISSLSPTQVAAGSQIQSLYVNGLNFISSSTVTYNGVPHYSSLQGPTQIQIALGPNDVATLGQYPVIVTNPSPGGGSSSPVNLGVVSGTPTGTFNFTLNATVGPITHSTSMTLTVQ
jgi:hypothetical protein